jgi:hypothetical protein
MHIPGRRGSRAPPDIRAPQAACNSERCRHRPDCRRAHSTQTGPGSSFGPHWRPLPRSAALLAPPRRKRQAGPCPRGHGPAPCANPAAVPRSWVLTRCEAGILRSLAFVPTGDIDLVYFHGARETSLAFVADGRFDQTPHQRVDPIIDVIRLLSSTPARNSQDHQPGDDNPIGQRDATARQGRAGGQQERATARLATIADGSRQRR